MGLHQSADNQFRADCHAPSIGRVAVSHCSPSPHNRSMYSAWAIQRMTSRAKQGPAREDQDPGSLFAQMQADIDAEDERRRQDDERRLEAERDPVQREALRRADAEQRAELAHAVAQLQAGTRRITRLTARASQSGSKTAGDARRMLHSLLALHQIADRAERALVARLTSYRLVTLSTLTLIMRQQQALTIWRVRLAVDSATEPPPQLLDTGAVISAPRPGPRAGTVPVAA